MVLIPGWYWTNFVLISAVYVFISLRVFQITNLLKDAVIPKDRCRQPLAFQARDPNPSPHAPTKDVATRKRAVARVLVRSPIEGSLP
eukprot:6150184-Prymnesium_polylepis.2